MVFKLSPNKRSAPLRWGLAISSLTAILGLGTGIWSTFGSAVPEAEATVQASVRTAVAFSCRDTETTILRKNGPVVEFGRSRIYIGYQQVSADNKNPILARFDNGRRTWCRSDYEVTGDDGEGYGLLWNGSSILYAVFSATGTQGTSNQDYRRFTANGWLTSYGNGGGPKVSVIAKLNPSTGTPTAGTFLTAVLSNGRTNSLAVKGLSWTGTRLVVSADSWFSPRRRNKSAMTCSGASPFPYRIVFGPGLGRVYATAADRCS